MCGSMCVSAHVCTCVCVSMIMRVHRHNLENISKESLLVLHLVPKLGLFFLSRCMFSAISASHNRKTFKEKIC